MAKKNDTLKKTIWVLLLATFWAGSIVFPGHAEQLPVYPPVTTYQGTEAVEAMLENISFTDIEGHWARIDILRMAGQGVFKGTADRRFLPDNIATRAEALTMVLRMMGLEAEGQKKGEELAADRGERLGTLATWATGFLSLAVERGLITEEDLEELENGLAGQPASRQEVAVWLAKALKLEPVYGEKIQYIYNFTDWENTLAENVPYLEAILTEKIMQGISARELQPDGQITRAQLVTLLSRVSPSFDHERGIERYRGHAVSNESSTEYDDDGRLERIMQRVTNLDGQLVNLAGETRLVAGATYYKDFLTLDGEEVGLGRNLLVTGQYVEYLVQEGTVLWLEITEPDLQYLEGTILIIDQGQNRLVIKNYGDNQTVIMPMNDGIFVTVNWMPADLTDLLYDQEVVVTVNNGLATFINGTMEPGRPGYILPGSKIRVGKVRGISGNKVTIVTELGAEATFETKSGTIMTRGSRQIAMTDLYPGDQVKLYFDGYDTPYVSRLVQETAGPQAYRIYRGKLGYVFGNKSITLTDTQEFFFGDWLAGGGSMTIGLKDKTIIYREANPVFTSQLAQSYLGSIVYVVTEKINGVEQAGRILVKTGDSWTKGDRIASLDWARKELRLLQTAYEPVLFHAGTIVTANGRLLDYQNLAAGSNVFLEANQSGTGLQAAVVSLDRFYHPLLEIYKGEIYDVRRNGADLQAFSYLNNHAWQPAPTATSWYSWQVRESSRILDVTGSEPRWISPAQFQYSYYTKEYQGTVSGSTVTGRKSAYLVTAGDQAVTVLIRDEPAMNEKVSIGRVKSIDPAAKIMTLEWIKDWSDYYGQWVVNDFALDINLAGAVFIKGNEPTAIRDIEAGDRVYLVRDNADGIIAIVQ